MYLIYAPGPTDPVRPFGRCTMKKVLFKKLENSQENTYTGVSLIMIYRLEDCNFIINESPIQMFSLMLCNF